ncbi:MAG: hypothetical protein HZB51_20295 [Chloroflexi bacterium]|nr:hypothetical protein [Chloroflexota bacterium]
MSKIIPVLAALSLVFTLTACDTGSSDTAGVDHLLLEIHSSHSRVKVGDVVQIRFTIRNTGQQLIVVESKNLPVMDIRVEEAGGHVLLTWSSQNSDKVSDRLEWKPGEVKVIDWTWTPKEGDVYIGNLHDIGLNGLLSGSSVGQVAGVTICASNVCQ